MRLTQEKVSKLKLPAGKTDHIEWDEALPGFGVRLRAGGSRGFVVQYKIGEQNRRMTIGTTAKLTLEQAKIEAKKVFGKVASGDDPQGAKKAARATVAATDTFKDVAERFLAYQEDRLRPASYYSTKLYLLTHFKRLHGLKINEVTRREVASVLSSIAADGRKVTADRARAWLSSMFGWAIKEGLCDANPTMNTNSYAGNNDRDRVLTNAEIVAIWNAVDDKTDYGRIVKLLFLTACRRDEIGGLVWQELKGDYIALPKERVKNGHAFDLPLSKTAQKLLASVERRPGRDFLFGQGKIGFQAFGPGKEHLDAKLKFNTRWQLRDIRRTVSTGMAELGVEPHIIEACLNHYSGHKRGVAGIYNRATYNVQTREAFERWASHLALILAQASGANVSRLTDRSRTLARRKKSA
jgi:integrase